MDLLIYSIQRIKVLPKRAKKAVQRIQMRPFPLSRQRISAQPEGIIPLIRACKINAAIPSPRTLPVCCNFFCPIDKRLAETTFHGV